MTKEEAEAKWKADIEGNSAKVDPEDQHEWLTLAYGYFLGLGLLPEEAYEVALKVYYTHEIG